MSGALLWTMIAFTLLGSGWALVALVPLYVWPQRRRFARWLGAQWAGTALVVFVLKAVIRKPRPAGLPLWGTKPTDFFAPERARCGRVRLRRVRPCPAIGRSPRAARAMALGARARRAGRRGERGSIPCLPRSARRGRRRGRRDRGQSRGVLVRAALPRRRALRARSGRRRGGLRDRIGQKACRIRGSRSQ